MTAKTLKRILYAEDEEDIRSIARIALEDIGGFNVDYCCNGLEVLDHIQKQYPDLVLLDVMMPAMDGPTVLQKLHEMYPDNCPPVVFMTAKIQPIEVEEYKKQGVIGVIAKPFDPMKLAEDIKNAWSAYHGK